jgi:hypothetical protein
MQSAVRAKREQTIAILTEVSRVKNRAEHELLFQAARPMTPQEALALGFLGGILPEDRGSPSLT